MGRQFTIILTLLVISTSYTFIHIDGEQFGGGQTEITRSQDNPSIWPRNGFDNQNTRNCPYDGMKNIGEILWEFKSPRGNPSEPPIIDKNGTIYLICESWLYSIYPNGTLKHTSKHWISDQITPPSIVNDTIFISAYGGLTAISLDDELIWTYPFNGRLISSPIADDEGNLYFSIVDYSTTSSFISLYPNGTLRWIIYGSRVACSSPAILHDKVFSGSYCFYLNGTEKFNYSDFGSSITIDKAGYFYLTSQDEPYQLIAMNPNGTVKWKFPMNWRIYDEVALDSYGNIYIGSGDRHIYCIYPNGTLRWKYNTKEMVFTSPLVDINDFIYIIDRYGYVYSFFNNGSLRWTTKIPSESSDDLLMRQNGDLLTTTFPKATLYCIGTNPPDVVLNITIQSGHGFINLTWTINSEKEKNIIEGYYIFRSEDNYTYNVVETIPYPINHFNDTSVFIGQNIHYYLVPYNFKGNGTPSVIVSDIPKGPSSPPINISQISKPDYLNISWDEPENSGGYPIESYRIYRFEGGLFLLHFETNELFFVDQWASAGVNYSYYVVAVTEFGEGLPSMIINSSAIGRPPPPLPISIGIFNKEISLNWSFALRYLKEYEISQINIYRNGSLYQEIDANLTHFNDTGLTNGIEYTYQLSSVNIVGEGNRSMEFTVKPSWSPTPPRNLTGWANTTSVILTWKQPIDDRGMPVLIYDVYRRLEGEDWQRVMILNNLSWTDPYVHTGTTYEYFVLSGNNHGTSERSNIFIVIIPLGDPPDPPVLTRKNLVADVMTIVWLEWEPSEQEGISYSIFRKTSNDGDFVKIATTTNFSYTETPEITNVTYYYYITATNEYGESLKSNIISIFVEPPIIIDDDDVDDEDKRRDREFPIVLVIIPAVVIVLLIIGIVVFLMIRKKKPDEDQPVEREDRSPEDVVDEAFDELYKDEYGEEALNELHESLSEDISENTEHPFNGYDL